MLMIMLFALFGCKWRDDFRTRQQPIYGELPPKPTLNEDSEQYVGDKVAHEIEGKPAESSVVIPEIDDRKPIPEVPEQPAGVAQ